MRVRNFITGLVLFAIFIALDFAVTAIMHGGSSGFTTGLAAYGVYRFAMQDAKELWS